jgi:hypothetical protein
MSCRTVVHSRALGLLAAVGLATARLATAGPADETPPPRAPARVYTNEDLDRVHPFAHETGVRSVPAVPAGEGGAAPAPREPKRGRGEDFWRNEARRVRERLADLAAQRDALRAEITERESERRSTLRPSRGGRSAASLSAGSPDARLHARLASLERRMRDLEDDLLERARREGALPGWLR